MNKENHKKSITLYILYIVVGAIGGGLVGFFASKLKFSVVNFDDKLLFITTPIIIIFFLTIGLIAIIVWSAKLYYDAKKMMKDLTDDNDEKFKEVNKKFSIVIALMSIGSCLGILIPAMIMPIAMAIDTSNKSRMLIVIVMAGLLLYFIYTAYQVPITVKCIEHSKKLNPEKKGFALDKKFQKDWLNSLDEAEKKYCGEAALHSFIIMTKMYSYTMVVVIVLGIFIVESYIFALLIGGLWMVHVGSYLKKSIECEFKKKKENL